MNRRRFLKSSTLLGLPLLLNGVPLSAIPSFTLSENLGLENDRILVLVQLIGGNDGLNTLIPLDQYEHLQMHRGNLLIPENDIISLNNDNGLHPNMMGFKNIFENDQLGIIQGVGYPNQNRSHFRSTEIWSTGSSSETTLETGWMGRYLDSITDKYPVDYPNAQAEDPFAIALGQNISETCQGELANFSMALEDPFSFAQISTGFEEADPDSYYRRRLQFLRQIINHTNAYSSVIEEAAAKGSNLSDLYPEYHPFPRQLKTVAQLIAGGLQTKVYVVRLGGFDTHANQIDPSNPSQGWHAELLDILSQSITAFQDDLNQLGLADRVLGLTFSEFGRRIKSNTSWGTDHGSAAPLFLFGDCVKAGITGHNPIIQREHDILDGVEMQFDFRDIYASILQDWFGAENETIEQIFNFVPNYVSLIKCNLATSTRQKIAQNSLKVYPQPVSSILNLQFSAPKISKGQYRILTLHGQVLRLGNLGLLNIGRNDIQIDLSFLPKGAYILQVRFDQAQISKRIIKL